MEYWDLYDKNKNKLDKKVKRGDILDDNEYHLVVNVWLKNDNNEFLIVQRSVNKTYPLMWECVGGSVLSGESSIEASIREVSEELGITINIEDSEYIGSANRYYERCPDILDVFLFKCNESIDKIIKQDDEVNDAKWMNSEEIMKLYVDGKFEANAYFEEVIKSNT